MPSGEKVFYEMGIKSDNDELINAEEWLRETDYIASKESEIQDSYKKRFEVIKDVLINLLPDVEDIRISVPSESSPLPQVEFKTLDGWLMLFQLSLGYQTMIAWMVDLAAQLFKDYTVSPNPIAEPAVVLIDEIDLHLHPKWQRTIMSYLSERFVNTQFIVTAHSPLIVQAAENANIVVLKRENEGVVTHQQTQDVQGWRIDQLLTSDLFDLKSERSPYYEKLLERRRQLLSKPELSH
jgi:predicted ATP-binding protein involved in virulence